MEEKYWKLSARQTTDSVESAVNRTQTSRATTARLESLSLSARHCFKEAGGAGVWKNKDFPDFLKGRINFFIIASNIKIGPNKY